MIKLGTMLLYKAFCYLFSEILDLDEKLSKCNRVFYLSACQKQMQSKYQES